jgi:hypothetical protein
VIHITQKVAISTLALSLALDLSLTPVGAVLRAPQGLKVPQDPKDSQVLREPLERKERLVHKVLLAPKA